METTEKEFVEAVNSVIGNDSELMELFNSCFVGKHDC